MNPERRLAENLTAKLHHQPAYDPKEKSMEHKCDGGLPLRSSVHRLSKLKVILRDSLNLA